MDSEHECPYIFNNALNYPLIYLREILIFVLAWRRYALYRVPSSLFIWNMSKSREHVIDILRPVLVLLLYSELYQNHEIIMSRI